MLETRIDAAIMLILKEARTSSTDDLHTKLEQQLAITITSDVLSSRLSVLERKCFLGVNGTDISYIE
jgi:hypothetical protein